MLTSLITLTSTFDGYNALKNANKSTWHGRSYYLLSFAYFTPVIGISLAIIKRIVALFVQHCLSPQQEIPNEKDYTRLVSIFRNSQQFGKEVEKSFPQGLVLKEDNCSTRSERGILNPYGDELSYKICKLLRWSVIPKTKIIRGDSTKSKYQMFAKCNSSTYTIQGFINGRAPTQQDQINLFSFQQAYLLNMLLGKEDADYRNAIYNPATQEIFEIDNELLGSDNYRGFLKNYPLVEQPLPAELLTDLISLEINKLDDIISKYEHKNSKIVDQYYTYNDASFKGASLEEKKTALKTDLYQIQINYYGLILAVRQLQNEKKQITIQSLQTHFQQIIKKATAPLKSTKGSWCQRLIDKSQLTISSLKVAFESKISCTCTAPSSQSNIGNDNS